MMNDRFAHMSNDQLRSVIADAVPEIEDHLALARGTLLASLIGVIFYGLIALAVLTWGIR